MTCSPTEYVPFAFSMERGRSVTLTQTCRLLRSPKVLHTLSISFRKCSGHGFWKTLSFGDSLFPIDVFVEIKDDSFDFRRFCRIVRL